MTYIILAAGQGTKLQPLTLKTPKSLYKLDKDTTVLQRMVRSIRKYDSEAEIVVVAGFMYDHILQEIKSENVIVIRNPFYAITSSLASLWFARKYLERENVTIINADIVLENRLMEEVICKTTDRPIVLIDSSIEKNGKFNVQVQDDKVCVMSKDLSEFYGQYICITKLDAISARFLNKEIDGMINDEMYDQLFETALVQMIFTHDFELYYKDIKGFVWAEIDCVDDLIKAKKVQKRE